MHLQITTKNIIGEARRSRTIDSWRRLGLEPTYVWTQNRATAFQYFSPELNSYIRGATGCINSHRAAWARFLESNNTYCLITEDDSIPEHNLVFEIEQIESFGIHFSELQTDSSIPKPLIVQLGWFVFPKTSIWRVVSAIIHLVLIRGPIRHGYTRGFTFGTHCYLINREMAEFMSKALSSSILPLDVQLKNLSEYYIGSGINFLRPIQCFAHQERLDSLIMNQLDRSGFRNNLTRNLATLVQSIGDAKTERFNIKDS